MKRKIFKVLSLISIITIALGVMCTTVYAAEGDIFQKSDGLLRYPANQINVSIQARNDVRVNNSLYQIEVNGLKHDLVTASAAYAKDPLNWKAILSSQVYPPTDYEYLSLVKNGFLNRHPNISVEQAFEDYFYNPQWEYFYSTENNHIVEFTGERTLNGIYGTTIIQFEINYESGTFVITYCEFNNKSQSNTEITQLLDMIYINIENTPYWINILPPNSIGTVWMEATYTNLTNHPITNFSMKVLLKDTNKTSYLSNYDTVMPGEMSPIFDTIGPSSMKLDDVEILTIDLKVELPDNEYLRVEYDAKLGRTKYNWYNY